MLLDVRNMTREKTKSAGVSLRKRAVFKYIRGCCKEEGINLFCVFTGR